MKKTLSLILATLMLLSVFSVAAFAVEAPVLKSLKCTFDGMTITWSAVKDAANYVVYRAEGDGEEAVIATTTKTKYVDKTVKNGVSYTYKVTVQTADGNFTTPEAATSLTKVYKKPVCDHAGAKWVVETAATVYASGEKHKVCPTCKEVLGTKVIKQLTPATPHVTKIYNGKGVAIKWNVVDGATSYNVYRRLVGKQWKKLATVSKANYTDKTAKSGTEYQYAVRAGNAAGLSDFERGIIIKYLAIPQNLEVKNTKKGIQFSWDAVKGAKSYKIYCTIGEDKELIYVGSTTKTTYLDEAVWAADTFTYTVKAVSGKYSSNRSATGASIVRLENPELLKAKSTKEGITVTWGAVEGAKGYNVYRKTANSSWKLVGKVNNTRSTAYLDKSAQKGVTYIYTVRARNNASLSSFNSKGISCKDRY